MRLAVYRSEGASARPNAGYETDPMFKQLSDFEMKRTPAQAFGFWLVYFLLGVLIAAIVDGMAGAVAEHPYQAVFLAGRIASVIYAAGLGAVICLNKSLGVGWYLGAVFGGGMAVLGGGFLGVIPAAMLTTRPTAHAGVPASA